MAKKFSVIIERVITTTIEIEADNAADARIRLDVYGLVEAAMDMATDDMMTARIKSIRKSA